VEALLPRLCHGRAIAANGRGGDKSLHVRVNTENGLRVFQFKYHSDGFPDSYRGRLIAITHSFQRAMQHDPVI
jgi:hypothetical protein